MHRFGRGGQVQNGPPPPSPPRSDSVDTTARESWHTTETTFQDRANSDHGTEPVDSTWNSLDPDVTIRKPLAQTGVLSFPVVDSPEHRLTPTGVWTNDGTSSARSSRGDGNMINIGGAGKPGPQQPGQQRQQPRRTRRLSRTRDRDPQPRSSLKIERGLAILGPQPSGIESTPSRSSSIKRKGEGTILMVVACD